MKTLKLCSLLLSLAMLICCLAACNSPAPDDDGAGTPPAAPKTPEEYIEVVWDKLLTAQYKETQIKDGKIIMNGSEMPRKETSVSICDGNNFLMEDEEWGSKELFYDGVFYVSMGEGLKNKYVMEEGWEELELSGQEQADFTNIKFKSLTLETDADGNTVLVGKGASETSKSVLEGLFAAVAIGSEGLFSMTIDYENVEFRATIDSEYRLLSQTAKMIGYATAGGGDMSTSVQYVIDNTITYEYGDQYALSAPADADAYTEVDSFEKLYLPQ